MARSFTAPTTVAAGQHTARPAEQSVAEHYGALLSREQEARTDALAQLAAVQNRLRGFQHEMRSAAEAFEEERCHMLRAMADKDRALQAERAVMETRIHEEHEAARVEHGRLKERIRLLVFRQRSLTKEVSFLVMERESNRRLLMHAEEDAEHTRRPLLRSRGNSTERLHRLSHTPQALLAAADVNDLAHSRGNGRTGCGTPGLREPTDEAACVARQSGNDQSGSNGVHTPQKLPNCPQGDCPSSDRALPSQSVIVDRAADARHWLEAAAWAAENARLIEAEAEADEVHQSYEASAPSCPSSPPATRWLHSKVFEATPPPSLSELLSLPLAKVSSSPAFADQSGEDEFLCSYIRHMRSYAPRGVKRML